MSLEGHEATGKTFFSLTSPLPIIAFSLDQSFDRAVYSAKYPDWFQGLRIRKHKYPSVGAPPAWAGDDITVHEMALPIQSNPDRNTGYDKYWLYFLEGYVEALEKLTAGGTIVLDTMTVLNRVARDEYLQQLQEKEGSKPRKQLQQIEYGHPNEKIRTVVSNAKTLERNLVITHHLKDEYGAIQQRDGSVANQATGRQVFDGVADMMQRVDVQLRMEKAAGEMRVRFVKCGYKPSAEQLPPMGLTWDGMVDIVSSGWYGPKFDRRRTEDAAAS